MKNAIFASLQVLVLVACGTTADAPMDAAVDVSEVGPVDAAHDTIAPDADAGGTTTAEEVGLALLAIDRDVVEAAPAMLRVTESGVPEDETGWLGRNRTWGALYTVRFQVGAGIALRMRLASGDLTQAAGSFRAIEVGVAEILSDGEIPSSLPDSITGGAALPATDVASAAAFFVGDACTALLALEASGDADEVASAARREALRGPLALGLDWLETRESLLRRVDASAPNRLFHDAVAFQSCAVLVGDDTAGALAEEFGQLAMDQYAGDSLGYFIEGGGFDTNYQAVNLYMAVDFVLLSESSVALATRGAVAAGVAWARERTDVSGAVDSTGNARTCGGCEVFLPGDPPKQVGLGEWLRALAYGGISSEQPEALLAADRFVTWALSGPTTSCYERADGVTLEPIDLSTRCL